MANFTNTKINQTYQRVVQVNGNAELQDGLGRQLSGSMGNLTVNGTLSITGHSDVSASLSHLHTFSSSLDNTYATDLELAAVSSSLALETAQLLNFSASLDATYATDLELNNLSSSVSAAYLSHTEWTFHSASIRNDISYDSNRIAALENKTLVSSSAQIVDDLDLTFATDTDITNLSSSVSAAYLSHTEWTFHSASIRNDISFDSNRIAALENKTLVSSSAQIDLSLATGIAAQAVTASYAVSASHEITYELSSSYANFATTASHALNVPDISALNAYTSSVDTRVAALETFSSSIDTIYLSDTEWTFHSASIRNDISYDSNRIAVLENKSLVSSSAQIDLSQAIGNDTYATDAELSAVSGALATSINTSVAGLNAASSSYALAADLTVATGSINVNETNIGLLTALTGSYITSASIGDYVKKDLLKAIVTGSADFDAFKTAILGL